MCGNARKRKGQMRVLILDDIKDRHDTFDKVYDGDEVIHAYTYMDFCNKLGDGKWDLVSLDHDLGDFVDDPSTYVDGWGNICQYTGKHAAMRIAEMDDFDGRVIIHSANPVGARGMFDILGRCGIDVVVRPFCYFGKEVE